MKKIISMSLYGNESIYINGSIENAKLIPKIYGTDWEIRYYTRNITSSIRKQLEELNCVIIDMDNNEIKNGRLLRFLAITEDNIVLIRDCDSIVSYREKMMVLEFLNSKKKLHIIRDHPNHKEYMMAGMFGFNNCGVDIKKIISESNMKDITNYGMDQVFLGKYVYPLFRDNMLIHDSFNKFYNERDEIIIRYPRFLNHIGQRIYLKSIIKTEDEIRLEQFKGYIKFSKTNFETVYEFMDFFMNCLKVSRILKRSLIINNYRIKNNFFNIGDFLILDELRRYTKIEKNELFNMSEITLSSKKLEIDEIKLSILANIDNEYELLNIDIKIIDINKELELDEFTLYNVIQLKDELNYEIEEYILKHNIDLYKSIICHDSESFKELGTDLNIINYDNLYDNLGDNLLKKEFMRLFSGIFRIHIKPPIIIEKISNRYWNYLDNDFQKI